MARLIVLGGTGYAGGNIVEVAAARGHQVTSYSRHEPAAPVEGVAYRTGDLSDDAVLAQAIEGADVVVSALSPRGELAGEGVLRALEARVAARALAGNVRFGVIGGAGSLLVADGGPRLVDTPAFPDAFKAEALELTVVLEDLSGTDPALDWFFVSPAVEFGAYAPGTATGHYRIGGDVVLADADGTSAISGPDLALAVVDEIERPAHHRARFTVAY